jgi:hypothetical protein
MTDVKIPKEGTLPELKPSNYQEWKDSVEAWFKMSHCLKIINGTTVKPLHTETTQEGIAQLAKDIANWEILDE